MKRYDGDTLRTLSQTAAVSLRRRKNLNLHESENDPIQRMLNAFEPSTYVRPHRHSSRWELFAILSGRAVVLTFSDDGRVRERVELSMEGARLIEIPEGVWHSLVSLESGTVLFEIKAGPYLPTSPSDFAGWAPAEGGKPAEAFERWLCTAAPGAAPSTI